MFEFLHSVMKDGTKNPESPNVFYRVSTDDVVRAEQRLGFRFPNQLRAFFEEVGSGFLKSANNQESLNEFNYINRFLTPSEVADLYQGKYTGLVPAEGFDKGELPFFEVGDGLYIVICPQKDNPSRVCWPFGDPIAEDLISFTRMLANNPRFYHG